MVGRLGNRLSSAVRAGVDGYEIFQCNPIQGFVKSADNLADDPSRGSFSSFMDGSSGSIERESARWSVRWSSQPSLAQLDIQSVAGIKKTGSRRDGAVS